MDEHLKKYIKNNFDFRSLKKAGFFGKDIKFNDYEKQAERICQRMGLKNIYDYSRVGEGTRYHLSDGCRQLTFASGIRNTFGEEILKTII